MNFLNAPGKLLDYIPYIPLCPLGHSQVRQVVELPEIETARNPPVMGVCDNIACDLVKTGVDELFVEILASRYGPEQKFLGS